MEITYVTNNVFASPEVLKGMIVDHYVDFKKIANPPTERELFLASINSETSGENQSYSIVDWAKDNWGCKWNARTRAVNLRASNTGVLLSGAKGSGKSLLGRLLSERAGQQGMATILVNKKIPGPVLNEELSKLEQPALVFLDEFEKVFNKDEDQEAVLGLLDGTQRSRHLFVLTVNRVSRMDDNLLNRPGRIYYHIEFNGLDASFIEDYCKRNLENIAYMSDIKRVTAMFETFNFDMLQALVQEINRYDEAPFDAVRYLNIMPTAMREHFTIKAVSVNGLKPESIYPNETNDSPLQMDMVIHVYPEYKDCDNEVLAKEWKRALIENNGNEDFNVTTRDLKSFDENTGVYVFVKNGFVFTFEPKNRREGVTLDSGLLSC